MSPTSRYFHQGPLARTLTNYRLTQAIDYLISQCLERRTTLMFLFFVAATDPSKRIYRFLKTRISKITKILSKLHYHDVTQSEMANVISTDDTSYFLENEGIIEKALSHWILIKNMPWIEYMFNTSKRLVLRISINISTICGLIYEFEDPVVQKILKYLLEKNIILNFTSTPIKALQRMSTDFKLFAKDDESDSSEKLPDININLVEKSNSAENSEYVSKTIS